LPSGLGDLHSETNGRGERYAIYWAPATESRLARIGGSWLGRDSEAQPVAPRPAIAEFASERLEALTAEPRRYGLHATLKPPFALAPGADAVMLRKAMAEFAARSARIILPPLRLSRLESFIALTLSGPCPALDLLAADCVRTFDGFRALPSPAELARRRAAGLSPAEEAHLSRWGYPYVLDCFRFHVTLTGPLDPAAAERLMEPLAALFRPATEVPVTVEDIALFHQPPQGAPFCLIERFMLGEKASSRTE
jgi:putative phosphonate metabolism protein